MDVSYNNIHKLIMMNKEVHDDVGMMHISAYQCFPQRGQGLHMTGVSVTNVGQKSPDVP